MKKLLLIHAIIEMIGGVVLIFKPSVFLMVDGQSAQTLIVAKMYGILAFTFGVACLYLYKLFEFNDNFKRVILVIMAFHLMIALQMYAAFTQGNVSNLGAFGLHLILALLFLGGYMNNVKAFSSERKS